MLVLLSDFVALVETASLRLDLDGLNKGICFSFTWTVCPGFPRHNLVYIYCSWSKKINKPELLIVIPIWPLEEHKKRGSWPLPLCSSEASLGGLVGGKDDYFFRDDFNESLFQLKPVDQRNGDGEAKCPACRARVCPTVLHPAQPGSGLPAQVSICCV